MAAIEYKETRHEEGNITDAFIREMIDEGWMLSKFRQEGTTIVYYWERELK